MNKYFKNIIIFIITVLVLNPVIVFSGNTKNNFSYLLYQDSNFTVWWATATYKIFKDQESPVSKSKIIKIFAAKNEYEPFQIIIKSKKNLNNILVSLSDFKNSNERIEKENITINFVEYVNIEKPTDSIGHKGLWPDPLPEYQEPFPTVANENKLGSCLAKKDIIS